MSHDSEKKLILNCLREIEDKLEWGPSDLWHSSVFKELSEKIHLSTGVLLSPTTLKRVWGKVSYENAPSISTLNALCQFIGYANWRAFKSERLSALKSEIPSSKNKSRATILLVSSSGLIILVALLFFSMTNKSDSPFENEDLSKIQFSSHPVTTGMPNSVIFKFDLKDIVADSILIQQYWDPDKTIQINREQKEATGIYYFPGYFRAKLILDGIIAKQHDLFIKTEGWLGTLDYSPISKYVDHEGVFDQTLKFNEEVRHEITSSEEPIYSTFHYIGKMGGISGDHFSLSTRLRHSFNEPWAVCQHTKIFLIGTKGALIIPFSISGCVSDISVMLNDVYISGKSNDLSALGTELSEFKNIQIINSNKNIQVQIEGREVFNENYFEPLGELVGVRFKFLGAGEVQSLNVSGENDRFVFSIDSPAY
ncbi:MAG: hypothetical protein JXR03_15725 [Cyclobacteriaceae bacterium]